MPKYFAPARYAAFVRRRAALAKYDLVDVQAIERKKFAAAGFDPDAGRERLDSVLLPLSGKRFDHVNGTDSVHWLLFACLSLTDWGKGVRDILEIGTFRGKTTVILKALFPQAQIVTCDLPDDDPILASSYHRDKPAVLAEYKRMRDTRVNQDGIRFVQANSFFLPQTAPGPYDLIWMDGGHLYPEVAWDMCNAWHMCRPGGMVLCDDVYTDPKGGNAYASAAGLDVINYLATRTPVEVIHFIKRENPTWAADTRQCKYVSMLHKPAGV
ncbi:MAG: class I SAM-dependent methyltransferase [Actinomycetia bacterium]|nr:class I SAM-dependent methyltransferase [Actinomycetes bacterium]